MVNRGYRCEIIHVKVSEFRAMYEVALKQVPIKFHVTETKRGNKYSITDNLILTAMCTWYLGSSWYTPDFDIVTINIQTFVPPVTKSCIPA
jgi:hypothetical protein